jgi:type IV secretory pathway VirB2 component (pilin)
MKNLLKKSIELKSAAIVLALSSSAELFASGDPFAKANDVTQQLIDGLKTWVSPAMVLVIMGIGIAFIFGKIPKTWAMSVAAGGIIVAAAGPIADMLYN